MQKTITYNKVNNFVVKHIHPRISYTTHESPFMLPSAMKILEAYVRFVYAELGNQIKPVKRVSYNKCLAYLLWLKTSVKRFVLVNPQYKIGEMATPSWVDHDSVFDKLMMFKEWFVMEFKYEVGIDA